MFDFTTTHGILASLTARDARYWGGTAGVRQFAESAHVPLPIHCTHRAQIALFKTEQSYLCSTVAPPNRGLIVQDRSTVYVVLIEGQILYQAVDSHDALGPYGSLLG
jgi:hypothetical protein